MEQSSSEILKQQSSSEILKQQSSSEILKQQSSSEILKQQSSSKKPTLNSFLHDNIHETNMFTKLAHYNAANLHYYYLYNKVIYNYMLIVILLVLILSITSLGLVPGVVFSIVGIMIYIFAFIPAIFVSIFNK